ncbi:hypothetical protein HZA45_03650 [Candidatus Peregrinibacteria bacterium]|nr:hypothetical protein [Candidatus Peregrinibacteria bacterium]
MSRQQKYIALLGITGLMILSAKTMSGSRMTGTASHDTIVICHTPPDPDVTMEIPVQALDPHLKHDDYTGPCVSSSSAMSSNESSAPDSSAPTGSGGSSSADSSAGSSESSQDSSGVSSEMSTPSSSSAASSAGEAGSVPSGGGAQQPDSGAGGAREQGEGGGGGGGDRDGGWTETAPIFRGHGLGEHASVLDFVLSIYGLQPPAFSVFDYMAPILPDTTDRTLRTHAAICSMNRYFRQLLIARPNTPDDYIDWIATRLANTIGEDPVSIKEMLLGRPHHHVSMNTALRSIVNERCAADAYVYVPPGESAVLPSDRRITMEHSQHMDQSHPVAPTPAPLPELHIQDESTDTNFAFTVLQRNDIFRDYGSSLTKKMHLIIVRDDFRSFYHIHPDLDPFGVWRMPFTPAAGGTYWLYANFTDARGHSYALRFQRTYAGDTGPTGMTVDLSREREIDGYHMQLEPAVTGSGMSLTYHITDAAGAPVRLENFMGAFGHSIIVSTDGFFIHSHPSLRAGGDPIFYIDTPPAGLYRIFTQFEIDGSEHMTVFDWAR